MFRKPSKKDTSRHFSPEMIQLSTLERNSELSSVRSDLNVSSVIVRINQFVLRSFTGLTTLLLILFYPVGAYAETAPSGQNASTEAVTSQANSNQQQAVQTDTKSPTSPPKPQKPTPPSLPKKPTTKPPKPPTKPQKPTVSSTKDSPNKQQTSAQPESMSNSGQAGSPDGKSLVPEDNSLAGGDARLNSTGASLLQPQNGGQITLNGTTSGSLQLNNNTGVLNNLDSQALTGDALVAHNTQAGSALTGDALTVANLLNMINSSSGFGTNGEIATFSSDIYGNVYGDLLLDPSQLASLQASQVNSSQNKNFQLNANLTNSIDNDIALNSQSGNAGVIGNTKAGDATSGSANAVVNIINMLNSAISSGGNFMGMLNIYGNLDGDILLPQGLLNSLLASNGANKFTENTTSSVNANLSDTTAITNNINTTAETGEASVAGNTKAGNATTGNAKTNVTILNLTGRNVVASNSLLVFVNVLGEWVGVIMDAPAGSTSAALGTGVTENTTNLNAKYDVNTNNTITNNVDVNARSGDASVERNTQAGDATSGDATASANIANITNSNFSLANWFGVLFINVFGTWNGSFGVNTAAGNWKTTTKNGAHSKPANNPNIATKVFQFVPKSGNSNETTLAKVDMNNPASAQAVEHAVKAANAKLTNDKQKTAEKAHVAGASDATQNNSVSSTPQTDYKLPALGFALGGSMLGAERLVSRRQRRK